MKLKGLKIAIIVLLILLILGGGAFAYLLLKTDLFLSNQQAFYKYMSQEENVFNNLIVFYDAQKVKEEAYNSNAKLDISVDYDEENIKFETDINTKKNGENIYSNVALKYQDEEFFDFNYLKEEDKHGIQFPGIKQYVVLENNNLKEFAKKFEEAEKSLDVIPNKISEIVPNKLIELTDSEKEEIKNLVINSITKNISEERYIKEKDASINVNGQNVLATGYSIELGEKDTLNIKKSVLENISSSEVMLQLIENKMDYIMQSEEVDIFTAILRSSIKSTQSLLDRVGRAQDKMNGLEKEDDNSLKEITKENITETLSKEIESLQEKIDDLDESHLENSKLVIYQNSGKTVKIKLEQEQKQESNSIYREDEKTTIIKSIVELDNLENTENKSHIILTYQSYINDELQDGQIMQSIIENQDGTYILKEQVESLKDEKEKSTSQITISRQGQTIKKEINITKNQKDGNLNIKYVNTINVGNTTIEEKLEGNEVILNELSVKQMEKVFGKIKNKINEKVQKKFPEFSVENGLLFGGGNGILTKDKNTANKVNEAQKNNLKAELVDAVSLGCAEAMIEMLDKKGKIDFSDTDEFLKYVEKNYRNPLVVSGKLTDGTGKLEIKEDSTKGGNEDIKVTVEFESNVMKSVN